MSVREALNRHRGIVAAVAVVAIVASLWFAVADSIGSSPRGYGKLAYFSDDDGKTYFADRIGGIVPYTRDGKEVVRAHVFKCPSKGTFVGYLQRYTPEAQEAMREAQEAAKAGRTPKNLGLVTMIDTVGSEYKKPGAGNPWKKGASADVVIPDGIMELCDNKPGERADFVFP